MLVLGSHTGVKACDELQESYCQIFILCVISVPLYVVKFDQTKPAKEKQLVVYASCIMDVKMFLLDMESGLIWTYIFKLHPLKYHVGNSVMFY